MLGAKPVQKPKRAESQQFELFRPRTLILLVANYRNAPLITSEKLMINYATIHWTRSVVHSARPGFWSMKRPGVFPLPPEWDARATQSYCQNLIGRSQLQFIHARLVDCDCDQETVTDCVFPKTQRNVPGRAQTRSTARSGELHANCPATSKKLN